MAAIFWRSKSTKVVSWTVSIKYKRMVEKNKETMVIMWYHMTTMPVGCSISRDLIIMLDHVTTMLVSKSL